MEKRYLFVLIGFFLIPVGLVLVLNLLLGERALGSAEAARQASTWQQQTRGITYPPPVVNSRPFKSLRLADRKEEINTVVLGASSLMAVTQDMLPPPHRPHVMLNIASTANLTPTVTAEAEYIARQYPKVQNFVIGLDWSIPALFQGGDVPALDMSPATQLAGYITQAISWQQRLTDALSLPKVEALGRLLRDNLRSDAPLTALNDTFFKFSGSPYTCAGGVPARDFDIIGRGRCLGFRYDGSWTFALDQHLSPARAQVLARAAAAPSSKFAKYACTTQGEPNAAVLTRLGAFARGVIERGGHVTFIVPPILPGMVTEMHKLPDAHQCLTRTYTALDTWARKHGLTVMDAASSELYGCTAQEFLDENHAWPECHARVLAHYWTLNASGSLTPGVYRPKQGIAPTDTARINETRPH